MRRQIRRLIVVVLAIGLMTGIASAADITSDLLAYWLLDGDVKDSVNDHHGELAGGAAFVKDEERGEVLEVDGVNGHAIVPHADDIVFANTDSYTLSVWVKVLTAPGHWAGIVNKSRDMSPHYGLWINPSNRWVAGGSNINGDVVTTDEWIHLALVQDADTNKRLVYVNGSLNFQGGAISSTGRGELWMGGAKSVNEFLHGRIDDVALYARVLAPEDIKALAEGENIMGTAVEAWHKLKTTWGAVK